ncbi:MAG TPA: response regulator transcription factor [Caulobacter sp.]|nr:response regulator transcription factor [Caulobacter sp.]
MLYEKARARVLIVEDDEAVSMLLETRLGLAGYSTCRTGAGWAGLQAMQEFQPDGVILDINLPGLDGFGVLETKLTRSAIRHIPVMMLTARHAAPDIRRALALGAKDYLAKPFDDQQLLARVGRLVRKKRQPPPTPPPSAAPLLL